MWLMLAHVQNTGELCCQTTNRLHVQCVTWVILSSVFGENWKRIIGTYGILDCAW